MFMFHHVVVVVGFTLDKYLALKSKESNYCANNNYSDAN